jgi:hypothetical protein
MVLGGSAPRSAAAQSTSGGCAVVGGASFLLLQCDNCCQQQQHHWGVAFGEDEGRPTNNEMPQKTSGQKTAGKRSRKL